MHALTAPLSELAEIEEICEERGREPGMLLLSGCVTSQKTHLMYALGKDYGHTLIVLSSEDKAKKLYEEYRFLKKIPAIIRQRISFFIRQISMENSWSNSGWKPCR